MICCHQLIITVPSMPEYSLIRSARRTLSLEVKNGDVIVRAPYGLAKGKINAFVYDRKKWIEEKLTLQSERKARHPEPDADNKARLITRAKMYLPQRVEYYGGLMGLMPLGISITGARTRFGSCSSAGRICFSWRLMQYPDEAVDYVVVHELAHLAYMNHSRDFYALIEKFMPDYRRRKKLLKE